MTTKNYFTVQNGVVGTAHKSRYGTEVDFRPAEADWRKYHQNILQIRPTDGWTEPVEVKLTKAELERTISPDGEMVTVRYELRTEFAEVVFRMEDTHSELTELGRQRRREGDAAEAQKRLRLHEAMRLREPADRAELAAWLDARLADPLAGGQLPAGKLVRKPSRARWAVGQLVDDWFRLFPLPDNQFSNRKEVFKLLQKRSGSDAYGAGGRLVQDAVLRLVEETRAARRRERLGT